MPLDFNYVWDETSQEMVIHTGIAGKLLMTTPQLNKGTAFTEQERQAFGLIGKLPPTIENLEQQKARVYYQLMEFQTDLQKHIYLNNLHDTNHVLFYALVLEHLEELMPLIYTPHIGEAVKNFSTEFRKPRGLFISYEDRHHIVEILENRSNPDIGIIVVTDGEAILGIGDQGVGSINIPIAKLMVYTLCAGINPANTLPIMLDVGTDNPTLLNDPFYLGRRYPRLRGEKYDELIDAFLAGIKKVFPQVFLHWEDFAAIPARKNLAKATETLCSFNDDIQGTGAVVVATIIAAIKHLKDHWENQKIIIFGAGTAGVGIADQVLSAMEYRGIPREKAIKQFWLIDKNGILFENSADLKDFQKLYARNPDEYYEFNKNSQGFIGLQEAIRTIQPSILIGCSSVGGAFTEECIRLMASYTSRPIILSLSNPNANSEIHPLQAFEWTEGKALVATGSPFGCVEYQGKQRRIAQCNNAFVFPGIGLGILASSATKLTSSMLASASEALSNFAPIFSDPDGSLLPRLTETRKIAYEIAKAVAQEAMASGVAAPLSEKQLMENLEKFIWVPQYCRIIPKLLQTTGLFRV